MARKPLMNSKEVDVCFFMSFIASAFMILGACAMFSAYYSIPIDAREHKEKNEHIREPMQFYEKLIWSVLEEHRKLWYMFDRIPIYINAKRVVLYDEYKLFITAYCSEECGWSYSTSSGATCHRSSEANRYEPTTCAVDLNYFPYGTLFYVPSEDRVYVAEDTGAFSGMWIDLYQDDMSDVIGYPTRYEYCYTCEVEEYSYLLPNCSNPKDVIAVAWETRCSN